MKKEVRIHIGELYACDCPTVINTLLGSCVAVCLMDPVKRIGGMNHILLPGKPDLKRFDDSARYGINAMELLINRIIDLGGNRRRLAAKVFGGAHVLPSMSRDNGMGEKNAAFVLDFLKNEDIKVSSKDTGGDEPRRIYFHTDTGDVFLKRIRPTLIRGVARQEKRLLSRVRREAVRPGEVDMF